MSDQVAEEKPNAQRPMLPFALGLAGLIALIFTIVSIAIYYTAGFNRFDLSRPGYEVERGDISSDGALKTYDTTSPVGKEALTEFLKEYDSSVQVLNEFGDFQGPELSDEELLLE